MNDDTPQRRLAGCTTAVALGLGLITLTAHAGDVLATASRKLPGSISNPSPGSSISV